MSEAKIGRKAIEEQTEKEPVVLTVGRRDLQNFSCEWCYKSIEVEGEKKQELGTMMRIPIPKDHPEPELFIEDTISRFASPKEMIVKIREGAVEIVFCFCSKQHKNEFKAHFRKKGSIVKRWSAFRKGSARVNPTKKADRLRSSNREA
jgi:hypothetical protein